MCQVNRIKQIVHETLVALSPQVAKHVQKPSMLWMHFHINPLLINRLITEVKIICEAIICNAISLDAIYDSLELPTASLVLTLPLHQACLLDS